MTSDEHIEIVRANMDLIRGLAKDLESVTLERRESMPEHVRLVHESTCEFGIHIALIERLLQMSKYEETESLVSDCCKGFPLIGDIPVSSKARPGVVREVSITSSELASRAAELLGSTIQKVRSTAPESEKSKVVYEKTLEEISLNRMSPLKPVSEDDIASGALQVSPTRRFAIEQQSSSGALKIRIIDDFAESLVNDLCSVEGHLCMGRIIEFVSSARLLTENQPSEKLNVLKADFKSAYRHCPILSEHLVFAVVILIDCLTGGPVVSSHYAMPFGALGAVYAWDRLGDAICHILSYFLILPLSRYVDDMFSPIYEKHSSEIRSCLIELSNLLGVILDPQKTPEPSPEEAVLGVLIKIYRKFRRQILHASVTCILDPSRAAFWRQKILEILSARIFRLEIARKMAGRLNFASSAAVGGTGASRLKEIYKSSFFLREFCSELEHELVWWAGRLENPRPVSVPIGPLPDRVVVLYTDAQGAGGVGAVLATPNKLFVIAAHVDASRMGLLERETQIIPLEACVPLIVVRALQQEINSCRLLLFIDNQSALGALKKGRSECADIHKIVNVFVDLLEFLSVRPTFFYVPSSLDIADFPSRGKDLKLIFPSLFKDAVCVSADAAINSLYV